MWLTSHACQAVALGQSAALFPWDTRDNADLAPALPSLPEWELGSRSCRSPVSPWEGDACGRQGEYRGTPLGSMAPTPNLAVMHHRMETGWPGPLPIPEGTGGGPLGQSMPSMGMVQGVPALPPRPPPRPQPQR